MSKKKPVAKEPAVPTIRLAGKDWKIPLLSPAQNKIVVPRVLTLMPKFARARAESLVDPGDESKGIRITEMIRLLCDDETYDQMCEAVLVALTRAHPDMTGTAFADMAISHLEIINAIPVIAKQAGLI